MTSSAVTVHYLDLLPALLVSVMITVMCARTLRRTQRLRRHGVATRARVLAARVSDDSVEYRPKRIAEVAFRTSAGQDVTTTVEFRADRCAAAAGDLLSLRYDPEAPESTMLDLGAHPGLREVCFGIMGILLGAPVAAFTAVVLLTESAMSALAPLLNR